MARRTIAEASPLAHGGGGGARALAALWGGTGVLVVRGAALTVTFSPEASHQISP